MLDFNTEEMRILMDFIKNNVVLNEDDYHRKRYSFDDTAKIFLCYFKMQEAMKANAKLFVDSILNKEDNTDDTV